MTAAPVSSCAPAVLVTRPEREANRWVLDLRQRGFNAQALPLIAIASAPDRAALSAHRAHLADHAAAMFVSVNAVQGFLTEPVLSWPPDTRAWTTGPGTAAALVAAGVPISLVDMPDPQSAQFDSEALWARVGSSVRAGDRVLIVRGGGADGQPAGRDWLASQLETGGVQVKTAVAYVRDLPQWNVTQRAQAQASAQGGAWWLLSSSEGVDNLGRLVPGQDWAAARALCTHPRIADAARAAGFGVVAVSRPGLDDVAAFLQSSP